MSTPRQSGEIPVPVGTEENQIQTGVEVEPDTHHREEDDEVEEVEVEEKPVLGLPEIPSTDLSFDFSTFIDADSAEKVANVQKRASNVMKLVEENEKLKAELKAMTDRLEKAERRKKELRILAERSE